MKPTEELIQEHSAIATMLSILERACDRLDRGAQVPREDLGKMLEFLRVFVDGCHHGKEEECLFPALERAGIPREHGPIGVMLSEHDLGRKYIGGMSEALTDFGRADAKRKFTSDARAYINLLNQHIQKENLVLFPMADAHLSPADQRAISGQFERIETEKVGAGKHEQFHAMLKNLKAIYLS